MNQPINRRQLLIAGLGSAAALAAGCTSSTRRRPIATALPSPVWPHQKTAPVPVAASTPAATTATSTPAIGKVRIIPRTSWTHAQTRYAETNAMNGIQRITVHHDGLDPVSLASASQVAERIEVIRHAHVEARGWADIGYHFVVDPQGRIWAARPLDRQGAHVKDHNEHNMGVLVMGHFDLQSPTPEALVSLEGLIVEASRANNIRINAIRTHQEWNPTACPGRTLQSHMEWTRSGRGRLAAALARS